ncbi:MAG: cadmium-translocating P-type ATPase [Chitinophagales bacterium]|nr:cadmium-translocating P-type ATPase [Chitinophagales bacterium]
MAHQHLYDSNGKQMCCLREEKILAQAEAHNHKLQQHNHSHHHDHDHSHHHDEDGSVVRLFFPAIVSFVVLITVLFLQHIYQPSWFTFPIKLSGYLLAFVPVGIPVIKDAWQSIKVGEWFSEFTLMTIATLGAFFIGEYPEAVAVMLFYSIGEVFQTMAVSKAKRNIKSLLDQRPDVATVIRDGQAVNVEAKHVQIGETIQLKPGEKLALDGIVLSDSGAFNTSSLTGESRPDTKYKGEEVLAGMLNLNKVTLVKVSKIYSDSKLSKILELVQDATKQKAPTELFVRKFAKIYTPIVVALAVALCLLPYFFVANYVFDEWLYRALIFLVISCPCALVISIPLGYFGGIGAASRHGILVKGSNFLDIIAQTQHVVMDKTGTMTEGVFKVQEVVFNSDFDQDYILKIVNILEHHSTHPIATAIHEYIGELDISIALKDIEEISGHGLRAIVDEKEILAGNFKLMDKFGILYPIQPSEIVNTTIAVAYDSKFVGYITIADQIKEDALSTIQKLHTMGVKTTMLSGDKSTVVKLVGETLGIDYYYGDLLPDDKVKKVKEIKISGESVAFVGDGINDAPVVALSDVGIAMGGLGSDGTIEVADIVIQDDRPSKIPLAIKIGKSTRQVVWQNIALAFGVKAIVLILGAGGVATMWEAVFADVGVALLAILNAIRIQRMNFD